MIISTSELLWSLGALWVLGLMIPIRFQNRTILLLLLTGASLILGIAWGLGNALRPFT